MKFHVKRHITGHVHLNCHQEASYFEKYMFLFAFIFQLNIMVSSVDSNFHIKSHSSLSQYVFWLVFQCSQHCCSLAGYLRVYLTTFSQQFAFYFYLIPSDQTLPILYSPFVTAFWLLIYPRRDLNGIWPLMPNFYGLHYPSLQLQERR